MLLLLLKSLQMIFCCCNFPRFFSFSVFSFLSSFASESVSGSYSTNVGLVVVVHAHAATAEVPRGSGKVFVSILIARWVNLFWEKTLLINDKTTSISLIATVNVLYGIVQPRIDLCDSLLQQKVNNNNKTCKPNFSWQEPKCIFTVSIIFLGLLEADPALVNNYWNSASEFCLPPPSPRLPFGT